MNESIRLAGEDGACAAGSDVNSSANSGPAERGHLRLNSGRPVHRRNWQISTSAATGRAVARHSLIKKRIQFWLAGWARQGERLKASGHRRRSVSLAVLVSVAKMNSMQTTIRSGRSTEKTGWRRWRRLQQFIWLMLDATAANSRRYKRSSEAAPVPSGLHYELLTPAISSLIDSTQTDVVASLLRPVSVSFGCFPVVFAVNGDLRVTLPAQRLN